MVKKYSELDYNLAKVVVEAIQKTNNNNFSLKEISGALFLSNPTVCINGDRAAIVEENEFYYELALILKEKNAAFNHWQPLEKEIILDPHGKMNELLCWKLSKKICFN